MNCQPASGCQAYPTLFVHKHDMIMFASMIAQDCVQNAATAVLVCELSQANDNVADLVEERDYKAVTASCVGGAFGSLTGAAPLVGLTLRDPMPLPEALARCDVPCWPPA